MLLQGNVSDIALLPGQYLDIVRNEGNISYIGWESGFHSAFDL